MGSVADVMRISPHKFTWRTIKKISLEAARGMAFLHGQVPPVLHCNFTANNLLISHNWAARVSGTSLALSLPSIPLSLAHLSRSCALSHTHTLSLSRARAGLFSIFLARGHSFLSLVVTGTASLGTNVTLSLSVFLFL